MRNIILWMSVSLDGYFEGPDHDITWHKVDAEFHQYANDELAKMSAFLSGRRTHELMAGFWPTAAQLHPDVKPMVEFAALWKRMPKFVYSRTLRDAGGYNSTLVRAVVPTEVQALKAMPGGDMTVGGAELDAEFMRLGLIDEYRIFVHPVIVGEGKLLFGAGLKADVDLVETKRFGNGVVMLRYGRRARLPL
jgi:dihydrofolate reductase